MSAISDRSHQQTHGHSRNECQFAFAYVLNCKKVLEFKKTEEDAIKYIFEQNISFNDSPVSLAFAANAMRIYLNHRTILDVYSTIKSTDDAYRLIECSHNRLITDLRTLCDKYLYYDVINEQQKYMEYAKYGKVIKFIIQCGIVSSSKCYICDKVKCVSEIIRDTYISDGLICAAILTYSLFLRIFDVSVDTLLTKFPWDVCLDSFKHEDLKQAVCELIKKYKIFEDKILYDSILKAQLKMQLNEEYKAKNSSSVIKEDHFKITECDIHDLEISSHSSSVVCKKCRRTVYICKEDEHVYDNYIDTAEGITFSRCKKCSKKR